MMHAANAVRDGLDQLDTAALGAAIDALAASRRIDIYGQGGGSAAVAEDAKLRLFRLGIPVAAFVDGHQQRMSAATLQPGDAVFAISNSGRSKPVIEAVEIARSFGAATIALTRPGTPLAAAAEHRHRGGHPRGRRRAPSDAVALCAPRHRRHDRDRRRRAARRPQPRDAPARPLHPGPHRRRHPEPEHRPDPDHEEPRAAGVRPVSRTGKRRPPPPWWGRAVSLNERSEFRETG